ncbi:SDR family NAD(P)-dependent oxidoreductase [Sphingobacterium detergens]|uniref:NAD(P)-dependent dehydrogenase (Short-subunit alcohol dehydrogenase family) n=1 Tax=Sphingobacterium detergens TaxID=1145106 RepID=A0A420BK94_SPHD1|nr:SDR family oxidoreductase [Sphingobacterium detergens]RKE57045.1 NAD(P)-dependent dehydrogenase (short-subunit alcohol dehydrogenase family) [Sphingobacterium detergens]
MAFTIDLTDKIVLITGGISGIGLGVSMQFAQAGATVIVCAELTGDDPMVASFFAKMEPFQRRTFYYETDVSQEAAILELALLLQQEYGRLDILVSNAGQNVFRGLDDCTLADWKNNSALNLASHWLLAKALKPLLMQASPGVIIIMASNHAYASIPGCFPYNVTKGALLSLVRAMAVEWGPAIRTVGLAPGFIDTPGNQKWFDSFPDAEQERQKTIDRHPVKRLGTAEEIGGWCVFLSSTYASFASGTTYLIDGGRNALMQED